LYIGSRTQIDKIKRDLRGVLRSLGVERSKKMNANCYLDTKRLSVSDVQSNFGLAVRETKISTEMLGESEYEVIVKPNADIVLIMKSGYRSVEMMKVKPRGDYMVRAPTDKEKMSYESMGLNSIDYSWLNSKPLELSKAYSLIRTSEGEMAEWCKSTLRQRLDQNGIRATNIIFIRFFV
jgi:hypothetical protein